MDYKPPNNQFFGLTSLGANAFDPSIIDYLRISNFTNDEIRISYNRIIKRDAPGITRDDVFYVLRDMYHGPTPSIQEEADLINQNCPNDLITLEDFYKAADVVREKMKDEPMGLPVTKEFTSTNQWKFVMTKHIPYKYDPREKQKVPMTMAQEIGWDKEFFDSSEKPYFPLNTSEETRFAEAMIKQGEYF